jgi:hypothetical protein
MRYNVRVLKDGSFAVDAGRGKYFVNTKTSDRNEAERQALIMSMNWHREQIERAYKQGVRFGLLDEEIGMGSYLC